MRLTRYTDYGLRVLIYLALREGQIVATGEIADSFGISRNHLLKVVRRLCELGYVDAKRGVSGGVSAAPGMRGVTIGEVVRKLEPQFDIVECFDEATNTCPITLACGLRPLFADAREAFLRALDRRTLGDVTRKPEALRTLLPVGPPTRDAADRRPRTPPSRRIRRAAERGQSGSRAT